MIRFYFNQNNLNLNLFSENKKIQESMYTCFRTEKIIEKRDFPWCDLQNPFTWGYPSKHLIRPFPNHLSLPNILSYTLVLVLNVGMQLETIVEQIITSEQVQTWNLFSNSSSHFSSRLPIYYIVVESINIYQILELTCKTSIRYTVS